jgi:hypothetical protein
MMKLKDLDDHPLAIFLFFVAVGIVVLFILLYAGSIIDKMPDPVARTEAGPSIYITRTDHILTLGGETVWILEYTVDGRFEAPAFTSQEAMTEYREYLDTIGTVYRRETKENQ